MTIRIVLADDHASYRATVREMIEHEPDLEVVAEASDGAGAIAAERDQTPDIVVIDVEMPRMDGIEATRRILAQHPAARVLALTLHTEACYVDSMLAAGANGYVLKQDAFTALLQGIREVAAGRRYVSPTLGDDRSGQPSPDRSNH